MSGGMIVGFDHDDPSIFKTVPAFCPVRGFRRRWSGCCTPFHHAVYKRLKGEDRLNDEKTRTAMGRMSSARNVVRGIAGRIHPTMKDDTVDAYFDRLDAVHQQN